MFEIVIIEQITEKIITIFRSDTELRNSDEIFINQTDRYRIVNDRRVYSVDHPDRLIYYAVKLIPIEYDRRHQKYIDKFRELRTY